MSHGKQRSVQRIDLFGAAAYRLSAVIPSSNGKLLGEVADFAEAWTSPSLARQWNLLHVCANMKRVRRIGNAGSSNKGN